MTTVMEIAEAKTHLDEILARAKAGEEFVIAEKGTPVVRLTPANGERHEARLFGEFAGKIHMSDDFAAPLTGPELAEWEK